MSAGRSIAIDFPMPSGTNRDVPSLAATWMTGARLSAANAGVNADAASITANRVRVQLVMSRVLEAISSRRGRRVDPEANDVDAGAAGIALVIGVFGIGIGDAAQRQRNGAELLRQCERFCLTRSELKRRGLADHDLLPVLFLDGLVDGEHANVLEDGFAGLYLGAGRLLGDAVALRQDHVNAVVRQDEAAGAGLRRNRS